MLINYIADGKMEARMILLDLLVLFQPVISVGFCLHTVKLTNGEEEIA